MSITDELREYAQIAFDKGSAGRARVETIADRIDREHRMAMEKVAAEVDESERRGFDQGFASADDWLAQHEDAMAEHGWIRLPLDADGVPIHVGDMLEVKFDTKRKPFTVSFVGERAVAFWVVGQPDLKSFNLDTVLVTHHHKPTVEDVLREFAREIDADAYGITDAKVAEFAAKLRLAGEGE